MVLFKAIRDKILIDDGQTINVDDKAFRKFLTDKLLEEVQEFKEEGEGGFSAIAELGDIVDVCYRLAKLYGYDLTDVRSNKWNSNGKFETNRVYIKY